jgi:hypothetical protein
VWFLLNDEAGALLPSFMGGCLIPHPSWEHGVAWTDFPQLQPLLEIIGRLLQKGLTGEEILWTFLSRGVQPLRQREQAIGTSLGPSCLICPSISRPCGAKAHARVQETLQRLKMRVEDGLELMCSRAAYVGKTSHVASSLLDQGILHLPWVSFFLS